MEVTTVWRLAMSVLCLIAALAGSPLRQAEAAGDLARSLSELDGGAVIEEIDGGVGDDSGETILSVGRHTCTDPTSHLASIGQVPAFTAIAPAIPRDVDGLPPARPMGLPSAHRARRHAWLQAFRF